MIVISKFRIIVKSLKGDLLTYRNVESYSVDEGFIVFKNIVDGSVKRFAVNNCEIEEEK